MFFPRSVGGGKGDEAAVGEESVGGRNTIAASGSASYGRRLQYLLLFSRRRPFGSLLYENFDVKVVQSWLGCVIAASVIAFPLMYRNARAAFEQVDVNLIYAGRTLGMSEAKIFWRVTVPAAWPGIASGTILTFARALGEYGASSMLAGNIPGKTGTIAQKIAMVIQDGDYLAAGVWVAVVLVIAFIVLLLMNLAAGRGTKHLNRW